MTQCHRILPLGKMGWDIATEGCKIASHREKAVPGGFLCWEDAERGGGGGAVACHTPPRSNGARHHGALWVLDVCLGPWAVVHGKTCGFARKKPQVVR